MAPWYKEQNDELKSNEKYFAPFMISNDSSYNGIEKVITCILGYIGS